jgi:hypothetical protein
MHTHRHLSPLTGENAIAQDSEPVFQAPIRRPARPAISLPVYFELRGIDRCTGYQQYRRGEIPVLAGFGEKRISTLRAAALLECGVLYEDQIEAAEARLAAKNAARKARESKSKAKKAAVA